MIDFKNPKAKLELDHIYGYQGTHNSQNLCYIGGGGGSRRRGGSRGGSRGGGGGGGGISELVYYVAAAGVILDPNANTQVRRGCSLR